MTVIARRIRANPVRTSGETWQFISDLICAHDDSMRIQLNKAANVAAMLIGEEYTRFNPINVSGCGPHVRIYTLHGEAAIDDGDAKEDVLHLAATDDWKISLPAEGDDFDIASRALSDFNRITVYDP